MILSGTTIGFVCVFALLISALLTAFLDRKEKGKGNLEKAKFLSRMALGLFILSFVGGVVMTLLNGISPREETGKMSGPMSGGMGGAPMGSIGKVNEEELKKLEEKVAKDPKDVASRERLGHIYLQMQDFENVFKMAHEALQANSKSAESRVHMGMVLASMGQKDQAMAQFVQALQADPKNSEAFLFKGMAQYQAGDLQEAKTTWQRYLRLAKPNDTGVERVKMFLQNLN